MDPLARMLGVGDVETAHTPPAPRVNRNLNQSQFADPDRDAAEMVSVDALQQHRHWDHDPRSGVATHSVTGKGYPERHDPEEWNALKSSIAEHGIERSLEFYYAPNTGHGFVGEGNHRLAIARELGMTHVPVRGIRVDHVPQHPQWKVPGEPRLKPDENGEFPGSFKVSGVLPAHYMKR